MFNSNRTGEQNYSYSLFGTTYPQQANFVYTATDSEIIIKQYGTSDLHWERLANTSSKQVASYDIVVNSSSTIKYTLTLER